MSFILLKMAFVLLRNQKLLVAQVLLRNVTFNKTLLNKQLEIGNDPIANKTPL